MTKTTYYLYFILNLLAKGFVLCVEKSCFVVCASGVTCGGKSTITRSLHHQFNNSVLVKQDDYYLSDNDPRQVQLPALQWRNRELMTSLDMQQMRSDVEELLSRRYPEKGLLILDGFMLFYDRFITSLCDLKFFFLLSKDACKWRRKKRNRRIPNIELYFEKYVWPAYLQYRDIAFRENPDVILIDGGANNETIIDDMSTKINQLMHFKKYR